MTSRIREIEDNIKAIITTKFKEEIHNIGMGMLTTQTFRLFDRRDYRTIKDFDLSEIYTTEALNRIINVMVELLSTKFSITNYSTTYLNAGESMYLKSSVTMDSIISEVKEIEI